MAGKQYANSAKSHECRNGGVGGASLSDMDVAIGGIRKQIVGFEEIKTSATTIVGGGDKILKRARLTEAAMLSNTAVGFNPPSPPR